MLTMTQHSAMAAASVMNGASIVRMLEPVFIVGIEAANGRNEVAQLLRSGQPCVLHLARGLDRGRRFYEWGLVVAHVLINVR